MKLIMLLAKSAKKGELTAGKEIPNMVNAMDYGGMTAPLVAAIKELFKINEELTDRISVLENK